jgi:hypothetical protein
MDQTAWCTKVFQALKIACSKGTQRNRVLKKEKKIKRKQTQRKRTGCLFLYVSADILEYYDGREVTPGYHE